MSSASFVNPFGNIFWAGPWQFFVEKNSFDPTNYKKDTENKIQGTHVLKIGDWAAIEIIQHFKEKTSCWPYWIFDSEVQVYLPEECAKIFLCNVMQHYLKNSLVYIVKIFKSNLFRWKNFNWHYYYDYRSVLLLYSFFALICIQNQLLSILNQIKSILLYLWQGIHHQNMSEDIIRSSDKFQGATFSAIFVPVEWTPECDPFRPVRLIPG